MSDLNYYRPNFSDVYNNEMDHVDITDHLGKNYQVAKGLLQRKWWLSIFFWALDRCILNAFVLYKSWHQMHGKKFLSHYKFRESLCMSWLLPDTYWPYRYGKMQRKRKRQQEDLATRYKNMTRRQLRMTSASPAVPAESACVVTTDSACEVSTITND